MTDIINTAEISNEGGLTPISSTTSGGLNLQLFKLGPVVHVAIGATVAAMVLVATTITVVVIAARATYNAPTLVDDQDTTYKTTYKDIYVLQNDKDQKGANLTVIGVTQPPFGKVQIMGNGQYVRYTPMGIGVKEPHFAGVVKFTYEAMNEKLSSTANVTVTVLNHPPEPVNLYYTLSKNSKNNVAAVMTDPNVNGLTTLDLDLDSLSIIRITQPANGVATISTDLQNVLYTPNLNFKSIDTMSYTITDGNDTAIGNITFSIHNDAPTARPDRVSGPKNNIIFNMTIMANDYDINGDAISIVDIRNSGIGQAFIEYGGTVAEYWPVRGTYGDSFEYTISDGELTDSSYVTVAMLNTPPIAGSVTVTVPKNSNQFVVPFPYGDVDKFETLNVTITAVTLGTISLTNSPQTITAIFFPGFDRFIQYQNNTWTLTYTPVHGLIYAETFPYSVKDDVSTTNGSITVNVVNSPPVAVPDTASVFKNSLVGVTINVMANDYDPNGDNIQLVSVQTTSTNGGTVSIVGNQVNYIPKPTFQGTDTFTYVITDLYPSDPTKQLQDTGTVTVTVINRPPIALNDVFTVPRGQSKTLTVIANDTDPDTDPISLNSWSVSSAGVTLTKSGNDLVYTALTGAPYTDTFTYNIVDNGAAVSNLATVTIYAVNLPPIAVDDTASLLWNRTKTLNILSNDYDPNGASDTAGITISSIVQNPTSGVLTLDSTSKTVVYTPNLGFVGTDTFKYQCVDPYGAVSNTATVTITVINDAPVAVNDAYSLHWGTSINMPVLTNDYDPDGDAIVILSQTSSKASIIAVDTIKYTATAMAGQEQFQYTITDWNKQSTATVTVNVLNTPPVANPDSASVHWSSTTGVTINVLSNDYDADGDAIYVNAISGFDTTKGKVTINSNTTITFIPTGNYKGTVTFTYYITDTVATAQAVVTINVLNENTPTSSNESFNVHWRTTPVRVNILTSVTDPDGDTLTPITTQNPAVGTLTTPKDSSTGIYYYNYTQPSKYVGSVSWNYEITDGLDFSTVSTVTGTIYNHPPTAKSYNGTYIPYSTAVTVGYTWDVVGDATDPDSPDVPYLYVITFTQGVNGTVTYANGKLTYVARSGTSGTDSFTYVINDGQANSNTAIISLQVGSAALGATDKSYQWHWRPIELYGENIDIVSNPNVTINGYFVKLVNYTGPNTFIQAPTYGTLNFSSPYVRDAGVPYVYGVNYLPNTGFIGTDTFIVKTESIDNTQTGQIRATVTITNTPPTSSDISVSTHWSTTLNVNVLSSCSDPDSDPVSISGLGTASCGSVSYNSATQRAVFVPPNQITTCTFTYTCTDTIASTTSTVTVSVTNTPPVTTTKYGYIHWTVAQAGYTIPDLRVGDYDPDGDSLTITAVGAANPTSGGTTAQVGNGATLTALSGSTFVNQNVTFSYTEYDGASNSFGLVNLEIYDNAPIGTPDYYSFTGSNPQTLKYLPVLLNDRDPDPQDKIKISSVNYQGSSTVTFNGTYIFYTPSAGLVGNETFTYHITDGMMTSTSIQVIVQLSARNPIANPDYISIMWNKIGTLNPILNDVDPDGNTPLTLTSLTSSPTSGTATFSSNVVTYTPNSQIFYTATVGTQKQVNDTFQYKVTDSYGLSAIGTITVNVKNTPPVAVNNAYTYAKDPQNSIRVLAVLSNDYDSDGDSITIQTISSTSGNGATISTNGTAIFYQASPSFRAATDTFTYTITDGQLTSAPATVSVTYTNQAPTCQSFSETVAKNVTYVWNLLTVASLQDPNGDPITAYLSSSNVYTKANVSLSGYNVTFISVPRRSGAMSFQFTVSDGLLSSPPCNASIYIVNNGPVANPDQYTIAKGIPSFQFDPTLNDYDVDGDTISLTGINDPYNMISNPLIGGTVQYSGNFVTYYPNSTFQSPPSLILYYNITDNDIDNPMTASSYANITVTNKIPLAVNDLFTTSQNTNAVIAISDMLSNDLDAQGQVGVNIQFYGLVDCSTLDSRYYCLGGSPVLNAPSTGYITVPYVSGSCQQNQFMYCINQLGDISSQSCATVVIQYTNCVCNSPVDVVYAIQISSAMSQNDISNAANYIQNSMNKLTIAPNAINVGIVWWSDYGVTLLPVTGDSTLISGVINTLKKSGTYNNNNITAGIWQSVATAMNTTRLMPSGRPAPKVLVVLSDGVPNEPCTQYSNCQCDSCGTNGGSGIMPGQCQFAPLSGGQFCYPYANTAPLAQSINNWKLGVNGKTSNWKFISMGFGGNLYLFNNKGWDLVQAMNYDPSQTFANPWENFKVSLPTLTDAICNMY